MASRRGNALAPRRHARLCSMRRAAHARPRRFSAVARALLAHRGAAPLHGAELDQQGVDQRIAAAQRCGTAGGGQRSEPARREGNAQPDACAATARGAARHERPAPGAFASRVRRPIGRAAPTVSTGRGTPVADAPAASQVSTQRATNELHSGRIAWSVGRPVTSRTAHGSGCRRPRRPAPREVRSVRCHSSSTRHHHGSLRTAARRVHRRGARGAGAADAVRPRPTLFPRGSAPARRHGARRGGVTTRPPSQSAVSTATAGVASAALRSVGGLFSADHIHPTIRWTRIVSFPRPIAADELCRVTSAQ